MGGEEYMSRRRFCCSSHGHGHGLKTKTIGVLLLGFGAGALIVLILPYRAWLIILGLGAIGYGIYSIQDLF